MNDYLNIVHHCFDVYLAMAILRLDGGCDFSKFIAEDKINGPEGDAVKKAVVEEEEEVSEDGNIIFLNKTSCFK